jgi:guanine deaminase
MHHTAVRGPILIPRDDGRVDFLQDGVIAGDANGVITFVGPHKQFVAQHPHVNQPRASDGIICPPFLDAHIHIPQHPIRGHFMDGVEANPDGGRLLAGLNRNVFPAEARFEDEAYARQIAQQFLEDTLANGVVGGAAYASVHASAARVALEVLPELWHVGMVLMNQHCPAYLRTDEVTMERDTRDLQARFRNRVIVTDRFAVAVDSPLRRRAVRLAEELGLRVQTHLNEQVREKRLVEEMLYPDAGSYANVYERDGLLAREPLLAHCVHMRAGEWDLLARRRAIVCHCPVSNTLLGSGVLDLDALTGHDIDWAICTDVGASPTTSLLVEMAQFLKVHRRCSDRATPSEALRRATIEPAKILHVDHLVGRLEVSRPMSFIEIGCERSALAHRTVDEVILAALLDTSSAELDAFASDPDCAAALELLRSSGLDLGPELKCLTDDVERTRQRLEGKVRRVTLWGKTFWQRP